MAAGEKSPIIMAGAKQKPAAPVSGRSESSRVASTVNLSAGQLPAVNPDRLRVDTGFLTVQVGDADTMGQGLWTSAGQTRGR